MIMNRIPKDKTMKGKVYYFLRNKPTIRNTLR